MGRLGDSNGVKLTGADKTVNPWVGTRNPLRLVPGVEVPSPRADVELAGTRGQSGYELLEEMGECTEGQLARLAQSNGVCAQGQGEHSRGVGPRATGWGWQWKGRRHR